MLEDVNNWDKIPTETYKAIESEAKVRFAELKSQSNEITTRAQQILIAMSGILTWFVNQLLNARNSESIQSAIVLIPVAVLVYILIVALLMPKKLPLRGTSISESFKNESDLAGFIDGRVLNEDEKIKVYYYHQCRWYQIKCAMVRPANTHRGNILRAALMLALIAFLIMGYISIKYLAF